ncbi:hypothetical protein [Cognatishimia sp. MH4019]|uniref:hypothetical protein n=1 Tax=Cognatishimia sp. MH4019 TaxID=2854030 RepID=UPI001CD1BA20|nr:hypothetical protein [Cognatishimia sp. MH4019]
MSYSWLPPLLNEIADIAGIDAAIAISNVRGGSRVSIPAKAPDGHWLVDAVGRESADKICEHFRSGYGGAVIDLPVGPKSAANETRKKVDQMIRDGVSADKIAQTMNVHRTTVFRRKAKLSPDENQPDLFD